MDRDKPDNFSEAIAPHVAELVKLHHPDMDPVYAAVTTAIVVRELDVFSKELRDLPKDPVQRELGFRQAIERFEAKFPGRVEPK